MPEINQDLKEKDEDDIGIEDERVTIQIPPINSPRFVQ